MENHSTPSSVKQYEDFDSPLNEQCASVFDEKTMHLKDTHFVEIDRSILEMIGFKNSFIEKKCKNGKLKLDANGKPLLKDM